MTRLVLRPLTLPAPEVGYREYADVLFRTMGAEPSVEHDWIHLFKTFVFLPAIARDDFSFLREVVPGFIQLDHCFSLFEVALETLQESLRQSHCPTPLHSPRGKDL